MPIYSSMTRSAMRSLPGHMRAPRSAHATLLALLPALAVATLWAATPAAGQELTDARRMAVAERLQASSVSVSIGRSGGSGVVVGEHRWVVTNSHVIRNRGRRHVRVRFGDGTVRNGRVIADDRTHDLAIVEIMGEVPAQPIPLGDSDAVRVGQTVLAFGSPFGLEGTLTQGIVSARRDLPGLGGGAVQGLIQTDAPINPGNSGGPLVNARGEIIGINTAILSRTGGSHGIGFAVPSSYVRDLLARAGRERASQAPDVAARPATVPAQPADPDDARRRAAAQVQTPVWLGIYGDDVRVGGERGVRVRRFVPGGPAAAAGVRGLSDPAPDVVRRMNVPWTGHVILAMDGQPIRTLAELTHHLARRQPGQDAVLTLTVGRGALRGDTTVRLQAPPRANRRPRRVPQRQRPRPRIRRRP